MYDDHDLWLLVPEPVRHLPADLAATVAVVIATNVAVLAPIVRETPLRVVLGLPFVLFVPGYAFIAALFPEDGDGPAVAGDAEKRETDDDYGATFPGDHDDELTGDDDTGGLLDRILRRLGPGSDTAEDDVGSEPAVSRDRGIDGIERVALSFGLSIAIVPLLGLVLNFTPWGIRLVPIMVTVSGFTLISTYVGAIRRWELDPEERFRVPYAEWWAAGRSELLEPDDRADAVLNVVLVVSVLLAVGSVGYAVAVPKQGESFTEFFVLTRNESGELVADDYPQNFTVGESRPIQVGIGNHEHRPTNYSVVVLIQDVRIANNSTTVLSERRIDRYETRVGDNETRIRELRLTPTMTGDRLRLTFLLYREELPADPTVDTAYRELHLWVNVSDRG